MLLTADTKREVETLKRIIEESNVTQKVVTTPTPLPGDLTNPMDTLFEAPDQSHLSLNMGSCSTKLKMPQMQLNKVTFAGNRWVFKYKVMQWTRMDNPCSGSK